jgi:glycosyltransferase involved in cell wall biosynthesis
MAEMPLTVLLVAPRFEVRGSSANTLRLAEGLAGHGIHARIVTPNADLVAPSRRDRLRMSVHGSLNVPVWGRIVRESILRALAPAPPDLIHIQSWSAYRTGLWLAQRLRRPCVLSVHDHHSAHSRRRFDLQWGRRIIAVSQSVKAELLSRNPLPPEIVSVIHPGVDASPSLPAAAVLSPGRLPVVGTAGPLEAVKGHVFFLGAAKRVIAVDPDIEFLVAGAGPEEENLRRVARELGISRNVTFFSNLFDFSGSLSAMDIFCLPSLRQGLGTVMLEAMALGRPVIASGVGGIYSVIRNNQTGLVVPPSDSARLAERILELLHDPVRARAIGEAGRRLVRDEFGVERMVAQTAEVYRDVLASPKANQAMAGVRGTHAPMPSAPDTMTQDLHDSASQ